MFSMAIPNSPSSEFDKVTHFGSMFSDINSMGMDDFYLQQYAQTQQQVHMPSGSYGMVQDSPFNDLVNGIFTNNQLQSLSSSYNATSSLDPNALSLRDGGIPSISDPVLSRLEDQVDIFPPATACTPPESHLSRQGSFDDGHDYRYKRPLANSRFSLEPEESITPSLETEQLFDRLVTGRVGLEEDASNENTTATIKHEISHPYDDDDIEEDVEDDFKSYSSTTFPVIRGASTGGGLTKPPKAPAGSMSTYLQASLNIQHAQVEEMCRPFWNKNEREDKRRIIRIERFQRGPDIIAKFSIVGSAHDNPEPRPSPAGVSFVEVSCLECDATSFDDDDDEEEGIDDMLVGGQSVKDQAHSSLANGKEYYITSVEVIKIVELLIGTENPNPQDRRRERGRIRSNLVPFWSKRPIRSKKSSNSPNAATTASSSSPDDESEEMDDYRTELAQRIMGYLIRKPRGFDKEVRILKWGKLVPALQRALQSYYVKIPESEVGTF
ncbi:unnamed protein product [Kuraishia capsulata CBS 1993]|uniref:DUF7082 domain-containing protein n=1 Tax=Kuraishia capsulata CBS 1993 TaxID=1382522 RepID=W6MKA8_9ASCO|nr:uncharacterized protein KUCA_T00002941001 [Kuraishia capsulata CBS 1993]CDK26964.1 unnamed protein product [Kuraishia capsulata CBS 1993]